MQGQGNQFVHKGDFRFVVDRERDTRALTTADANVAAHRAEMEMCQHEAARRAKLTTLSISVKGREDDMLTANSAADPYRHSQADRSTAQLTLIGPLCG